MEKWTAHVPLTRVQALRAEGRLRITRSALKGADDLGLDEKGIADVVAALTAADFCKSMTTYADHRVWQDVYRPNTTVGPVYLKVIVIDDVLVVSFKRL